MITLAYPAAAPTQTITLPNPDYSNVETLDIKTTFAKAMSGKIRSWRKTPVAHRLSMTIKGMDDTQSTNLLAMTVNSMSGDILLTDHRGAQWTVRIITNPVSLVYTRDDREGTDAEQSSASIEFEGTTV